MLHVCFAAKGIVLESKNWSGTPYRLATVFRNSFPEITISTLSIPRFQLIKLWERFYGRFFYLLYTSTCRGFLYPYYISSIRKKINCLNPDWVLFFADDFCVSQNYSSRIKYAAYIDGNMRRMIAARDDLKPGKRLFMPLFEKRTKKMLNRLDILFTQNEWTKESIIEDYHIDPNKIFNVGFGINAEMWYGEKDYSNNLLLIVLRKGVERMKGLYLLLDAFEILKKRVMNVRLAVVGTEEEKRQEGVEYYYNCPREKTLELFRAATLYVMPAFREPNGITYLEALANRTPIVGLNRFAFPEFSGYGKWGFGVEYPEPVELARILEVALKDKNQLRSMGIEGQQFVADKYRWELVARKMSNIMNV